VQRSKLQRYSITSLAVASNVVGTVAKRRRKRVPNLVSRHPLSRYRASHKRQANFKFKRASQP
jgi:hypothetical protein